MSPIQKHLKNSSFITKSSSKSVKWLRDVTLSPQVLYAELSARSHCVPVLTTNAQKTSLVYQTNVTPMSSFLNVTDPQEMTLFIGHFAPVKLWCVKLICSYMRRYFYMSVCEGVLLSYIYTPFLLHASEGGCALLS